MDMTEEEMKRYLLTGVLPGWLDPSVTIEQWRAVKVWDLPPGGPTYHVYGVRTDDGAPHGRIGSPISMIDRQERRVLTRSRFYELKGPSGQSPRAEAIWEQWSLLNGVEKHEDVTELFLSNFWDVGSEWDEERFIHIDGEGKFTFSHNPVAYNPE